MSGPASSNHGDPPGWPPPAALIPSGEGRIFIDGEELVGGPESMHWAPDGQLVSIHPVKIEADPVPVMSFEHYQAAFGPDDGDRLRLAYKVFEGSFTIAFPGPSLWKRLWCWAWHGHWPSEQGMFDFAMDYWSCPCGKVRMPAEELLALCDRYSRRPPFG